MADSNEEKKDEVPAVRFSEKKVDDSWKEEVRREREAAARAAAGKPEPRKASPAPAKAPASAESPAAPTAKAADADDLEEAEEAGEAAPDPNAPKLSAAEQQQSKIFMNFLAGLAQQTLMQMGEMESPYTGQREVDLQGARYTIELLATVQNNTNGNLLPDEATALKEALHDLKIRFVEVTQEMQRQMQAKAAGGPGGLGGGGLRPGPGGSIPGGKRR